MKTEEKLKWGAYIGVGALIGWALSYFVEYDPYIIFVPGGAIIGYLIAGYKLLPE